MSTINPVLPLTALLKAQTPDVWRRSQIYDPTWDDPSYVADTEQKVIPAIGSLVQDSDGTPLWVVDVDSVTYVPSYTAVPLSTDNDNVVSLLNYGNTLLRLYVDYRRAPYPVTPDTKCMFIGKSPRSYTLVRYPGTAQETIISQYYNAGGTLVSQSVPMQALDQTQTSWYLPKARINVILDHNEEIEVRVYNEDGAVVYTAFLHAQESAVINENVMYSPTIVGMTVTGNQQLANGTFFLYEKQDFASLGLTATLVYDDGTTYQTPIDGLKCVLYGHNDFISSFSGLLQYVTVKYFRSENETISSNLANETGEMISVKVPVTVIPNTLGVTVKIVPIPTYNASTARYVVRYYLYYSDGRGFVDVTPNITITSGALEGDAAHFGIAQTYAVSVDMKNVDPVHYPTSAIYQQTIVMTFNPPNQLVKYSFRDSSTSQYIFGLDNSGSRRPSIRFDSVRGQYFVPSYIFGNKQAFLNSFYTQASPPYDPSVALVPQEPTHFLLRSALNGDMLISAPIAIENYAVPFNILNDVTGQYLNATVVVEFIYQTSINNRTTLFGAPCDITRGSYVNPTP